MKQKVTIYNAIIRKKNDETMVEKVYLWITLSLKSTFHNFFCLITSNLQQNWIRIHNECLQGITQE
jgi:FtsH-binding integral membrane protein